MTEQRKKRSGRPQKDESEARRIETMRLLVDKCEGQWGQPVELQPEEVVDKLGVTRQTAIKLLAEVGAVLTSARRTRQGGIALADRSLYFDQMLGTNRDLKRAVGRKFAEHIAPGTSIGCAAGTTIEEAVVQLHSRGVFAEILTNNCGPLECLPRQDVHNIVMTGGSYHPEINACVGDQTAKVFREARCRVAACGVSGINERGDIFVRFRDEVEAIVQLLEAATESIYILADVTKLALEDMWNFANLGRLVANKDGLQRSVFLVTNSPTDMPAGGDRKKTERVFIGLRKIKGLTILLA